MVTVEIHPNFARIIRKIRDNSLKERVKKQIQKIIADPEIGKPMKYARKSTRELYVAPFRLSYLYVKEEDKVLLLDLYHKDKQ